jgi:hypothetical protein
MARVAMSCATRGGGLAFPRQAKLAHCVPRALTTRADERLAAPEAPPARTPAHSTSADAPSTSQPTSAAPSPTLGEPSSSWWSSLPANEKMVFAATLAFVLSNMVRPNEKEHMCASQQSAPPPCPC